MLCLALSKLYFDLIGQISYENGSSEHADAESGLSDLPESFLEAALATSATSVAQENSLTSATSFLTSEEAGSEIQDPEIPEPLGALALIELRIDAIEAERKADKANIKAAEAKIRTLTAQLLAAQAKAIGYETKNAKLEIRIKSLENERKMFCRYQSGHF